MENKAQDAAYPGKVIVTYPSIIDYSSSQVGRCENIVFQRYLSQKRVTFEVSQECRKAFTKGTRRISGEYGVYNLNIRGHSESRLADMAARL